MVNMDKQTTLLLVVLLIASSLLTVLPVKAEARTLIVPDDYPTISAAIQNASAGDTVLVRKGTYQETSIQLNKSLSLIAEDVNGIILNLDPPLLKTNILRNWLWIPSSAITINADNVKLQGFTINIPRANYGYGGGLHAEGDRIELIDNRIENNSLYLSGASAIIKGNLFADTLEVIGSNQTISENSIKSLKIQGSYGRISCNKITDNSIMGQLYLNGSFNIISANTFPSVSMEDSSSNLVIANSLGNLVLKRVRHGCSDNLIIKNIVTGNGGFNSGISVQSGSNNTVSANTIRDCDSGLSLSGTVTENSVYLNNFINNSKNMQYYGEADWTLNNRFDNGAKGNYYDDYKGADNNWDGIGDNPFTFEGTRWDSAAGGVVSAGFGQDRYPLMKPVDIDSVNIDLPEWVDMSSQEITGSAEPFPVMPGVIALAVTGIVVGVCLIIYFKKRRR
jgi:nitrous oxidase accessory protein